MRGKRKAWLIKATHTAKSCALLMLVSPCTEQTEYKLTDTGNNYIHTVYC